MKIEVPVFGANLSGFHGCGNAGLMFRGEAKNNWRDDRRFCDGVEALKAMRAGTRFDAKLLVGQRAILGEIGLMKGTDGWSYGLVTTERPGEQGIVSSDVLLFEFVKLLNTARNNPTMSFVCLRFGMKRPNGFSWWEPAELRLLWQRAVGVIGYVPSNLQPPSWAF